LEEEDADSLQDRIADQLKLLEGKTSSTTSARN
jgi:hypothetical protein